MVPDSDVNSPFRLPAILTTELRADLQLSWLEVGLLKNWLLVGI
jgi:hypothetical protein